MFNKLRKSLPTPTAEPAQREDVPYWATLKSIYSSALAKKNTKKAQRRLRRQAKRANGAAAVDKSQPGNACTKHYPVKIVGKLPPDGIPRPPSFIHTARVKHFQVPQPRMPAYADDRCNVRTQFPERASVRHSLFSNANDPFSVRPYQLLSEKAPIRYSSRSSRCPTSCDSRSSTVHAQPILEDASPTQTLPTSSDPSHESVYSIDSTSLPIRSSPHLSRLSTSADVWQKYGEEIDDSDSDSTYNDSDSESISSVSSVSVSSAGTAFYSCDDDKSKVFDPEKQVIHKAQMDVLAVAEALRDTQDERTSMEIKFREGVVTGLAHVLTEAAAHSKAKRRHLKRRSNYSLMSLDDRNKMPGALVPTPGARGRSASTAKLL